MIRTDSRLSFRAPRRSGALPTLQMWYETWRQREALATLDDRILQDIGLTRDDARREAHRPFWDL